MEEKVNGIVLNSVNYGENDKIISVFTLEKGVVSASLKGVKKAGAKLKFASEPFCFVEFIFSNKAGKNTVIGASLKEGFYPIREDIEKLYSAYTVISYIKTFFEANISSPETFILTVNTLKELAYKQENPKSILVRFLLQSLALSGFGLNIEGCIKCGKEIKNKPYFDYNSGGFLCEDCFDGNGREVNFITYSSLQKAKRQEELTQEESVFALRLLDFYINNKTEENLKPLKELLKM